MKAKQVLGCVLSAAMVTSCLPGTAFAAGAANKPTDGGKEAVKQMIQREKLYQRQPE